MLVSISRSWKAEVCMSSLVETTSAMTIVCRQSRSLKMRTSQQAVKLTRIPSPYPKKYRYCVSIPLPTVTIISTTSPTISSQPHASRHSFPIVALGSYVNSALSLRSISALQTRQRTSVLRAWMCLTKALLKQCSWQKRQHLQGEMARSQEILLLQVGQDCPNRCPHSSGWNPTLRRWHSPSIPPIQYKPTHKIANTPIYIAKHQSTDRSPFYQPINAIFFLQWFGSALDLYCQQMKMVEGFRGVVRWLFLYPQRIDISPHHSLTSPSALLAVRAVAFAVLSFRYYLQISQYYASAFNMAEYLTQFGFLLTWLFFALAIQDYITNALPKDSLSPHLRKGISLLFEVAMCMESVVTILFWSILYDYSKPLEAVQLLLEVGVHGFPFLCLLADLSLNTFQFPKHHALVVVVVGLLYIIVNASYSLCIKPVYKPIDWVSVMSYVYIVGCLIFVFFLHNILRLFWEKYRRPRMVDLLKANSENYFDFDANTINP